MSINTVILSHSGLPAMSDMEKIHNTSENVQLELVSGQGYPGEKGNYFANSGTLYLTNKRLIYVPINTNESFKSLTIPLHFILDPITSQEGLFLKTEVLNCRVIPGNMQAINLPNVYMLNKDARLKLYFHQKKSFEFHSILVQLKSRPQAQSELPNYDNLYNLEDVDPVPKYAKD